MMMLNGIKSCSIYCQQLSEPPEPNFPPPPAPMGGGAADPYYNQTNNQYNGYNNTEAYTPPAEPTSVTQKQQSVDEWDDDWDDDEDDQSSTSTGDGGRSSYTQNQVGQPSHSYRTL